MKRLIMAVALFSTFETEDAIGQPVAEKQVTRIGEVKIFGMNFTRERVIRRAIDLYPGQVLQKQDLQAAERKLNRLGIFHATVEVEEETNADRMTNDSGMS